MLLRHVLIRFLLLAVFFNTAMGMPAHEAVHLQNAAAAAAALPAPQASDDAAEHDQEADGACAWCLAYAHLGTALSSPSAARALPVNAGVPPPRALLAFVPSPGHWPFASRDPPRPVA
ncbi:hypothetical protein LJR290_007028 [Variovorax sp. LjRoot290]|uniref:DUF2946 family protein n=1 Tax=unclassified Variovorax TaxID=663243 RepID=UPI003ECCA341